ncbi:hypothetical protein [Nostoc sp. MS1]|uniref:hypothetical protein n=1 Tax=Nostoc sp. MS1 TaxID=2764711 RepID=UPI001CC6187C|nr:hypothetical protein [Nostoc sp. MS1]BCL35165.1 hypothetical protein NSMS1_16120 [Nostoc sp. MS1]
MLTHFGEISVEINMVYSSLTLLASTAINSFKYKLLTQPKTVCIDEAIAQLESEVAELEKYGQELLAHKQQQQQEMLQETVTQGIEELDILANKINTLASQLEAEMSNFKKIAVKVNRSYQNLQQLSDSQLMEWNESTLRHSRTINIWEVHNIAIPIVMKQGKKFIITTKIVDLFKAEEIDAKTKAKLAQKRRSALEAWLVKQNSFKDNLDCYK